MADPVAVQFNIDGTVGWLGHGCSVDDTVVFTQDLELSMGVGIAAGVVYYVVVVVTGDALKVSARRGGNPVAITAAGVGLGLRLADIGLGPVHMANPWRGRLQHEA